MRTAAYWVLAGFGVLVASQAAAETRLPKTHLIYVARQHDDGRMSDETQVRCDLAQGCNLAVSLRPGQVETLHLRVFAEDGGGFSVVPTAEDCDGRLAIGRRLDVGWGPRRSASALVAIRPLREAEEDEISMFGLVIREDQAPLGHVIVAVSELRAPGDGAMH